MINKLKSLYFDWRYGAESKISLGELHKGIKVAYPLGVQGMLLGGPYRKRPEDVAGIRLDDHQPGEVAYVFGIPDFGVPTHQGMLDAQKALFYLIHSKGRAYVGCTGGMGRTGLFMACAVKTMQHLGTYRPDVDPVYAVRKFYHPRAVETAEQEAFVSQFDPSGLKLAYV